MKKIERLLIVAAVLCFCGDGQAVLIDRGGGLIYDTVLDVTWLQDANYAATDLTDLRVQQIISNVGTVDGHTLTPAEFCTDTNDQYTGMMSWWAAKAWTQTLEYTVADRVYDNWRMPTGDPSVAGVFPNLVPAKATGSEMGHLWYVTLQNTCVGFGDPSCSHHTGPFSNISSYAYPHHPAHPQSINFWTSSDCGPDGLAACTYSIFTSCDPYNAFQAANAKLHVSLYTAWAVTDGDVAVPIPGTICLVGLGGLALVTRKRM